jgi:transcriptional regulator with XRE-family HTH domain
VGDNEPPATSADSEGTSLLRQQSDIAPVVSALRRARLHRNWVLTDVVRELDTRDPHCGVTESLVSAWELGKRRTSSRYRKHLCEIYGEPPEVLFAHQDARRRPTMAVISPDLDDARIGLTTPADVVTTVDALLAAMLEVVREAREYLVVTGSRSRDLPYLQQIEEALRERPRLVHYRVLFGPPHHGLLRDHLLRLLELRDPNSRAQGMKTLHVGMLDDLIREPERFLVASERRAVVTIPSLVTAGNFDAGVVLTHPRQAWGLVQHVKQLYFAAEKVETPEAVRALQVLR